MAAPAAAATADGGVVFLTYVASPSQERAAAILLDSLRTNGGRLAGRPFFVAHPAPRDWSVDRLRAAGAEMIAVPPAPGGLSYPFLTKVRALAEAEDVLKDRASAVVYMDAESVILGEPVELVPSKGKRLAIRPVHLANTVGRPTGSPLDGYWSGIYGHLGGQPPQWPPVRSLVDQQDLRPYFSSVAMGFDPSMGLMTRWRAAALALMADQAFQAMVGADPLRRAFLHQAILSALVTLRLTPAEVQVPSPLVNYPMALDARVPAAVRPASLDRVSVLYVDQLWGAQLDWWKGRVSDERIRRFLERSQEAWHTVRPGLYWEEGFANTYLVATPAGNVLVDPGGAASPDAFLRRIPGELRAIVFTHTHTDHTAGAGTWWKPGVPIVAQEGWRPFRDYQERLSAFFARRDAVQGNVLARPAGDPWPTVGFGDAYAIDLGDRRVELFAAPGETPDHAIAWLPHLKAAIVGDNVFGAFPNLAPPRGSTPRWALDWVASLDRVLALEPEVLCAGHMDPIVGRDAVRLAVTRLRDAIQYVHDQTVAGMNAGTPLETLARQVRLPDALALPETYARVAWAVKGIYGAYAGWFDEDPATLVDAPTSEVAADLVAAAGGTAPLVARARECRREGRLASALRLLDVVLAAKPEDGDARALRRDVLGQLAAASGTFVERKWLAAAAGADPARR